MPKAPKVKAVVKTVKAKSETENESTALKTATRKVLSPFKKMAKAFSERYQDVMRVIDEALTSENLRERIWAVDQILKRANPDKADAEPKTRVQKQMEQQPDSAVDKASGNLSVLSDEELLLRIEAYLYDAPCN